MSSPFLFVSERLGFRLWRQEDEISFHKINSCQTVMQHFPRVLKKHETVDFMERMNTQYEKNSFTYFAVCLRENTDCIGFIGLSEQSFTSEVTPCIDIGWRLSREVWGKGLATEGAMRCLAYAFDTLQLERIRAIAPQVNKASIAVMEKIGMKKLTTFDHPKLENHPELYACVCYEIQRENYV